MIDAIQQKNPGINVGGMGRSILQKQNKIEIMILLIWLLKVKEKLMKQQTQIARGFEDFQQILQ